jgi:hypothetical protein
MIGISIRRNLDTEHKYVSETETYVDRNRYWKTRSVNQGTLRITSNPKERGVLISDFQAPEV